MILCPTISGVFLGSVAVLCVYPSAGAHALGVGAVVAGAAFVANAFAICITAAAAELDGPRFERLEHRLS